MSENLSTTPTQSNDKNESNDKPRLWAEHIIELEKRAITVEYAEKVGLFSFPLGAYKDHRKKYHLKSEWPGLPGYRTTGIAIPYPKTADGIPRIRIRSDKTKVYNEEGTEESEIPRYVCQKDVPVVAYLTPEALDARGDTSIAFHITEAPLKACSLTCHGYVAIGLGGVSAGAHDSEIKKVIGEVTASEELRRINWKGRKVYLVFDAGIADNPQVAHGASVVWKTLSDLGADVWIVTIPFRHPSDTDVENGEFFLPNDQGPDDYIAKNGVAAFQERVDAAIPLDPEKMVRHLAGRPDELREAVRSLPFAACLSLAMKEGRATIITDIAAALPKGSYGKRELAKLADSFTSRLAARAKEETKDSADLWERGDEAECADKLIKHFGEKGQLVADGGDLFRYSDGVYTVVESAELISTSAGWAGQPLVDGQVLRVKHSWQIGGTKIALAKATQLGEKKGFFGGAPNAVGFQNGVLVVEGGRLIRNPDGTPKLHDHDPKWRLRARYDFDYVPGLRPEKILSAFRHLPREGEKDLRCWGEFSGASLFGMAPRYGRALMLLGAGGGGKTTIQNMTQKAFPAEVISAIAPQSLDTPCNRAKLLGKRLNVVSDMPERTFFDTGPLKAVITGDRIEARNLYQDPFDLHSWAGWLLSANRLAPHNDNTRGFARRWIIIEFPKHVENPDPHFLESVEDEIPALVSWFVDGLCNLLDRGEYDIPATSERLVSEWVRDGSQIDQFASDCLDVLQGPDRDVGPKEIAANWTTAKRAYEAYTSWAEKNGHKRMSSTTFGKELRALLTLGDEGKIKCGNFYPVKIRLDIDPKEIEEQEKAAEAFRKAGLDEEIIEAPCRLRDEETVLLTNPDGTVTAQRIDALGPAYRKTHVLMVRDGDWFRIWKPAA